MVARLAPVGGDAGAMPRGVGGDGFVNLEDVRQWARPGIRTCGCGAWFCWLGIATPQQAYLPPSVGKHCIDGTLQAGAHGIGEQLCVDCRSLDALMAQAAPDDCQGGPGACLVGPHGAAHPLS